MKREKFDLTGSPETQVHSGHLTRVFLVLFISLLCVLPGTKVQAAAAARVGSTNYSSFEKAFNAVGRRGTITLLKNTTLKNRLTLTTNKEITVNLNRHTLSTKENGEFILSNGTVTFRNGTLKERRVLERGAYNILHINQKASVVLKNVTCYGHITNGWYAHAGRNGSLLIDGGTFKPIADDFLISNYGKLQIDKGTFKNRSKNDISNLIRNLGTCTINGGTFTSSSTHGGIFASAHTEGGTAKTTIRGGSFRMTGQFNSDVTHIMSGINVDEGSKMTITGGDFYLTVCLNGGNLNLKGGTITSPVTAIYNDGYGYVGKVIMRGGTVKTTGRCSAVVGEYITMTGGKIIGGGDVEKQVDLCYYPVIYTSEKNTVSISGNARIVNKGSGDDVGTVIRNHK